MHSGLLAIQIWIGLVVAAHGSHKLSRPGWLGGYGLKGNTDWFAGFGLPFPKAMAIAAGLAEVVGGLAFAAGFLTPVAAGLIGSTMIVAARTDHAGKGFWAFLNGPEYVLTILIVVLGVAFNGAGAWSVDEAIGWDVNGTAWGLGATAMAVLGAGQVLLLRRLNQRRTAPSITPDAQEAIA